MCPKDNDDAQHANLYSRRDSMRQTTFEVTSPASILALTLSPIDHSGPEGVMGRKKECNQRIETQINSIYS
jgi:hypothetical protein